MWYFKVNEDFTNEFKQEPLDINKNKLRKFDLKEKDFSEPYTKNKNPIIAHITPIGQKSPIWPGIFLFVISN